MKPHSAGVPHSSSSGAAALHRDPRQVSPEDFPLDATPAEKLWYALNWAVLAPSSHNTQPWRFHIHSCDLDLYADYHRALPVVDPHYRELTMSCGAALLHLRVTLQYFGYQPHVEYVPDPARPNLLARVQISTRSETDADSIVLFNAITERRTNRQAFEDRPVPLAVLEELQVAAEREGAWLKFIASPEARAQLADLVAEADRRQWADRQFRQELAAWIRPWHDPRRDGLTVASQDLGAILSHAGPLAIRTFDLGKGRAAKDREVALYSPVLAVLGTERDDLTSWLLAGQGLARTLLEAQSEGVSASFLNSPVEVPELRERLTPELELPGLAQIVLRFGYGPALPSTPRRPVRDVLLAGHVPGESA